MAETLIFHRGDPVRASAEADTGASVVTLSVVNMRCGGCMKSIEQCLAVLPGVCDVRVNLSLRRVTVTLDPLKVDVDEVIQALEAQGFKAAVLTNELNSVNSGGDDLLKRLAVAGFGTANVMLLSVAVWAGLASDMDASLRTLFHWLSALIALPVIGYSGQPFFRSAGSAIAAGRLNMDVPISLGILLATGMSVVQTSWGTEQVYFDAAVTLTFFLLIGRFLDERTRSAARGAAQNLLAFQALTATIVEFDGTVRRLEARQVMPGMRVIVAKGERIAIDGEIRTGRSDIDESIITGEGVPRTVEAGDSVHAGALNLTSPIEIVATHTVHTSLLAEIARLMVVAEQSRGRYRRLADRAAAIYAPAVHVLGFATFSVWMLVGASWDQALTYAVAVLIITCPCALALAVPAVQVAATSRLFEAGVIMKAADGLERLAQVDTIVFDKTGTLTTGTMRLANADAVSDEVIRHAAAVAASSRHPYARAVVAEAASRGVAVGRFDGVEEVAGSGLQVNVAGRTLRLGSAHWVGAESDEYHEQSPQLWFRGGDGALTKLSLVDTLRSDAARTASRFQSRGYMVEILSGDRNATVLATAEKLGIEQWSGELKPNSKIARVEELARQGRRVLVVGDGINDAPALAAGCASLSPASAADIAQTAADGIFQGEKLSPVMLAVDAARGAQRLALQNFGIALAYNVVCVPLAAAGYVTPLIAALAMSGSSILVTLNAVRLFAMPLHSDDVVEP